MSGDPRPERRVELSGRTAVLRYDANALCELEEALGVAGFQSLMGLLQDLGYRTVRAFVWAGMLHGQPDLTIRQVGAWIPSDVRELLKIYEVVAEAFSAALGDLISDEPADAGGGSSPDPS